MTNPIVPQGEEVVAIHEAPGSDHITQTERKHLTAIINHPDFRTNYVFQANRKRYNVTGIDSSGVVTAWRYDRDPSARYFVNIDGNDPNLPDGWNRATFRFTLRTKPDGSWPGAR